MYLLHISEAQNGDTAPTLCLEYHVGEIPPYAILSHRWGLPADEVTFADMMGNVESVRKKKGYSKVENCCLQALEYGLEYAWIDTCCIDKTSSAELSEAINSMWSFYQNSKICFAYLEDVPYDTPASLSAADSLFSKSAWFERGWTLQELIAPHDVIFFPDNWGPRPLGDKIGLADVISSVTGIRKSVLQDRSQIPSASIAERMSWASRRRTTRVEDEAYSLMGLFSVNMATIYGEGRRAFIRLQEEIMRTSTDQTIFAWSGRHGSFGMLATSPQSFKDSSGYVPMEFNDFSKRFNIFEDASSEPLDRVGELARGAQMTYSMTNFGLQISLPIARMPGVFHEYYFAFIACTHGEDEDSTIIFFKHRAGRPRYHFHRVSFGGIAVLHWPVPQTQYPPRLTPRLLWISDTNSSFGLSLESSLSEILPRRYVRLQITSSIGTLFCCKTQEHSGLVCDWCPRSMWSNITETSTDNATSALIGPSEYFVITFRESGEGYQSSTSLVFIFGLHNDRIWYSFQNDVPFEKARDIYEKFDMFNFGKSWDDPQDVIKLFGGGSHQWWNATARYFGSVQLFQTGSPTNTNDGKVVEDFKLWFFY